MQITGLKTDKLVPLQDTDIFAVLDKFLPKIIKEASILAVTSKIISITEGSVVKMEDSAKDELIKQHSQYFLPRKANPYNVSLTITQNNLSASAGIDESNGNGFYILWPKDPQSSANSIRAYLRKKFNLKNLGVMITDSKTTPFRWGVTSMAIAYSGFKPLLDYIGKPDLFGRLFQLEKRSLIDSLSSAAGVVMGEGSEQTPLALIEDIKNIEFQDSDPTQKELDSLKITLEEDLYSPLLTKAHWQKGDKN